MLGSHGAGGRRGDDLDSARGEALWRLAKEFRGCSSGMRPQVLRRVGDGADGASPRWGWGRRIGGGRPAQWTSVRRVDHPRLAAEVRWLASTGAWSVGGWGNAMAGALECSAGGGIRADALGGPPEKCSRQRDVRGAGEVRERHGEGERSSAPDLGDPSRSRAGAAPELVAGVGCRRW